MKYLLPIVLSLSMSGCAALSDGLKQANEVLGAATTVLSPTSATAAGGKSYSIPNKSTPQYEIRNLKLTEVQVGDRTDIHFSGEAYNKTNKLTELAIIVPVYTTAGLYVTEVRATVHMPPKEQSLIDSIEPFALREGRKLNIQKINYRITQY